MEEKGDSENAGIEWKGKLQEAKEKQGGNKMMREKTTETVACDKFSVIGNVSCVGTGICGKCIIGR